MIDIHCHIIPGVDDGAKDLEESLEMAKIAQSEGIKTIINTSHYNMEFDYIMGEKLLIELDKFNNILKKKKINVDVKIGNELYYSEDFLETIESKEFYTLNNSRYVLIEFSPTRFPKQLMEIVYELKIRGYIPILAHVERYREVQDDPRIIEDAVKEGALVQINASTVLGKGSKGAVRVSELLLNSNLVHFIATDAHGSNRRRPVIRKAYDYISRKYGECMADRLFVKNPECVINNEDILLERESDKKVESKIKKSFLAKLFSKK
ncbi:MAG: CpsB/CapC family capsule biosynthesis tyrosine phosphatase [Romboutsia sp.]